ncbi:hypothetical protein VIGAN_07109500 [Vigna angularis var. angularis]|uniref:Piwi domain-containing protein n=1 Tax=Vigna angularis var. angularis TaxID=157739 RepID=A0A0S3SHT5_PHAAN|nr:hypothetical protein VIGAN_07109500 [Vigna angularis var. angularis]
MIGDIKLLYKITFSALYMCHNFEYQGTAAASELDSCGLVSQNLNQSDKMQDNSARDRVNSVKAIEQPFDVFEEDFHNTLFSPLVRVEKMLQLLQYELPGVLEFLFCLLPERNYELYGPWKKRNLADFGVVTQCIVSQRVNDQYLTNVLLKINAKLGGLNSILGAEHAPSIPVVSKAPTIIIGMDVSHGSPGQTTTINTLFTEGLLPKAFWTVDN